jgi:hypothetical protein
MDNIQNTTYALPKYNRIKIPILKWSKMDPAWKDKTKSKAKIQQGKCPFFSIMSQHLAFFLTLPLLQHPWAVLPFQSRCMKNTWFLSWDSSTLCSQLSLADFPWSWHTQCHAGIIETFLLQRLIQRPPRASMQEAQNCLIVSGISDFLEL